ncbi:nucleotidyltransferase domain-containing protein [Candidatus Woesearchaeota archaeon]|nr:nucleotidyltransferase domain-containing protein [Candidatus Woesearchaeota archaeon]
MNPLCYARGESFRDVDVCIFLMSGSYSPLEISKKKLAYTQEQEKYDVQIFQQLPLYLRKRVFQDAKFVYCRAENLLYDLFFSTEREFEHFKPIYENYLEAVAHG